MEPRQGRRGGDASPDQGETELDEEDVDEDLGGPEGGDGVGPEDDAGQGGGDEGLAQEDFRPES